VDRRSAIGLACALLASAALLIGLRGVANADPPQWLHVRRFVMHVDRAQVRVGESFHLTIDLRTDEPATNCNSVILPDFYGLDSLGDERRTYTRAGGTDCTEVVTLSPSAPGPRTIAPATLDAIDANTSRPSRFSTNTVTMQVLRAPLAAKTILWNTVVQMLKALVVVFLGGAVLIVGYWALRRVLPGFAPVRRIESQEAEVAPSRPAPVDEAERWSAVVAMLSAQPTRKNVIAVRVILRDLAHARDDEAFGELSARLAASTDQNMLEVMRAIERAAFIDDEHLADAVRDAIRALKQLAYKQQALA
jgi:hypothetical protein